MTTYTSVANKFYRGKTVKDDDIFLGCVKWHPDYPEYGFWISPDFSYIAMNDSRGLDSRRLPFSDFYQRGWTARFKDVALPFIKQRVEMLKDPSISPNSLGL